MESFYFGLTGIMLDKWVWNIRFCIKMGYICTKVCEMSFMNKHAECGKS